MVDRCTILWQASMSQKRKVGIDYWVDGPAVLELGAKTSISWNFNFITPLKAYCFALFYTTKVKLGLILGVKTDKNSGFPDAKTITWILLNESLLNCTIRCYTTKGRLGSISWVMTSSIYAWVTRNKHFHNVHTIIIMVTIPQKESWDWCGGRDLS